MNVVFACPQCHATQRHTFGSSPEITCVACGHHWTIPSDAMDAKQIHRCVICPSTELFVRKDFSQRLGVSIVVLGLAASCVTWFLHRTVATFGILFATAAVDFVLYFFTGNLLQCYRCHAEYRGAEGLEKHSPFSLETHERYRQQAARLGQ